MQLTPSVSLASSSRAHVLVPPTLLVLAAVALFGWHHPGHGVDWSRHMLALLLAYAATFLALGLVCFLPPWRAGSWPLASALRWLGVFALLLGCFEIFLIWQVANERRPADFAWINALWVCGAFLALLEFARRLWQTDPWLRARPWHRLVSPRLYGGLALSTVLLAATIGDILAAISVAERYLVALPGAALSGVWFWRQSTRAEGGRAAFAAGGCALMAYAPLAGTLVEPTAGTPGWLPDAGTFLASAGVPVQILRSLCILLLSFAVARLLMIQLARWAEKADRTAAELALRVAERTRANALAQHALDSARDAIAIARPDGCLIYVNAAFVTLWGYRDADEAIGSSLTNRWREPAHVQQVIEILNRQGHWSGELEAVDQAGQTKPLQTVADRVSDKQGRTLAMMATFHDLSELRRAQREERSQRAFYEAIVEHAGTLVLVLDPQGRIVRFNHACEIISGRCREEVMRRVVWEMLIPPEQVEVVRDKVLLALVANPDALTSRHTNEWLAADGSRPLIDWYNTLLFDDHGQVSNIVSVGVDVTQRARAKAALAETTRRLNEAQRIAKIGSWSFDRIRSEFVWSEETFRIFEVEPARFPASYAAFIEAVHPEDRPFVEAARQRMLTDRQAYEIEHRLRMPDGRIKWIQLRGESEFDAQDGEPVRSIGTVQDITERHELTERLAAAKASLERQVAERTAELQAALDAARQSSEAKSAFLSGMSHELRTPMNAILGFSQLLQLEPMSNQQQDAVNEIYRAGRHLLALIDDLLDLTRIEAGQLAVTVQSVGLTSVVNDALAIVQPMIVGRHLKLANNTPDDAGVLADPVRLRQVLVNLLSNAAKYNREGGRISIDVATPIPRRLRLQVTDTGPGIAPERMPRLFQTFERLGAEHSGIDGTGIGLALCRRLAELMGGTIGVESQLDKGSTFWIDLPVPLAAAPVPAASVRDADIYDERSRFKVLYIEDNRANLKVVELMFKTRPHWQLVTATTGIEGLGRARENMPGVILLDIHLPGMDGYAVLDALRADDVLRSIPVIALSADAMPVQVERGLRAGFRDYLPKPLDLKRLIALLTEVAAVRPR